MAGLIFTVIYNVSAGILRAIGDYRAPFVILLITCCINIVLDLLFVAGFRLGVAGVSLATVVSQLISVLLAYIRIGRKNQVSCLSLRETLHGGGPIIAEILKIGMPSGLQNSLVAFSNLFVWRYVNRFGYAATAGVGIAMRLDKFVSMPCKAFGTTITTCIGQNIGAGSYERIHSAVKKCMVLSLSVITGLELLILMFTDQCAALFNSNPEVVAIAAAMLRVITPLYGFFAVREILYGILRGHGYTNTTTALSLVGMVGIRQLFLVVSMAISPTIINIYWCYPIAWGSTTVLIYLYYQIVKRRPAWEHERNVRGQEK